MRRIRTERDVLAGWLPCGTGELVRWMAGEGRSRFHHVPEGEMGRALREAGRVAEPGSYYEIIRLSEDEADLQSRACAEIRRASDRGLEPLREELFYMERSFADYAELIRKYIDDGERREAILRRAGNVARRMCRAASQELHEYRFRSIARLDVLRKPVQGARTGRSPQGDARGLAGRRAT